MAIYHGPFRLLAKGNDVVAGRRHLHTGIFHQLEEILACNTSRRPQTTYAYRVAYEIKRETQRGKEGVGDGL